MTMRTADITGTHGRAWRLELGTGTALQNATVASYLLYVPGAHICWDHWLVGVAHLREIEGGGASSTYH